jgi:catechol 2,3-dioxygenase-like lactoylglutathione lyase family enzyme
MAAKSEETQQPGGQRPAPTYGLTHLNLAVSDLERSRRFYERAFGAREYWRDARSVQLRGPGPHDVLALELDPANAGKSGGIGHFGFRLMAPEDIGHAMEAVKAAGGTVIRHGEFQPGEPYAYVKDPDGYEIELWYEPANSAGPYVTGSG